MNSIPNNTVATGNNRVNSSNNAGAVGPLGRTSIVYPGIIPANSVLPVTATGTSFYVRVATAEIDVRPLNGVFNTYFPGTGLKLQPINAFSGLEVRNSNSFPVVFQLFIGYDEYIDNTLIVSQTGQSLVAFPTYDTASSAAAVAINDLSGTQFTDLNGNLWYALEREAIYVFNPDAGVTLLLQAAGASTSGGPAVAVIYPVTSLRYAASGDYALSVGGGNINAIVSELYQAIPAIV